MSRNPADAEETLARKAVSRLRARLRQGEEGGGPARFIRLGVKFCGGCNPSFDRGRVFQRIREELAEKVCFVPADEEAGLLLIINGCASACADTPAIRSGRPAVVVSAETAASEK